MPINTMDSSGAQVDPTYNFDIEQARIARQRALAQKLAETQQPQGQMVSGWYVAPRGGAYLAAGLDKLMGAYAGQQADRDEKDNIAAGNANAVALAKQLAELKGAQKLDYGTTNSGDAMGPPQVSYAAPTFDDKLPFYQQLANSGKFGQLVAQKEMEKDLAGPSYQKIGEGETLLQYDKNGRLTGQVSGGQKKTELDHTMDALRRAHPDWSESQVIDYATKQVVFDPESKTVVNKATDAAPVLTRTLSTTNPQAPAQPAQSQGGSNVAIPTRGQRWAGPDATKPAGSALPQATAQANPASAWKQQKLDQERAEKLRKEELANAPKKAEAQEKLSGIDAGIQNVDALLGLIGYDSNGKVVDPRYKSGQAQTGPIAGRALFFTKGNQDFDRRAHQLVYDAVNGKMGGGLSDGDRKAIEAKEASSKYDPEVNRAALLATREILVARRKILADEAATYGAAPVVNTQTQATGSGEAKFDYNAK